METQTPQSRAGRQGQCQHCAVAGLKAIRAKLHKTVMRMHGGDNGSYFPSNMLTIADSNTDKPKFV